MIVAPDETKIVNNRKAMKIKHFFFRGLREIGKINEKSLSSHSSSTFHYQKAISFLFQLPCCFEKYGECWCVCHPTTFFFLFCFCEKSKNFPVHSINLSCFCFKVGWGREEVIARRYRSFSLTHDSFDE